MALVFAPWTVSISFQFFFPTQNGLIACSARLLSRGILKSVKNALKYFSWFKQYLISFAVSEDAVVRPSLSLHQRKNTSTNGATSVFLRFNRSEGGSLERRLSVWDILNLDQGFFCNRTRSFFWSKTLDDLCKRPSGMSPTSSHFQYLLTFLVYDTPDIHHIPISPGIR